MLKLVKARDSKGVTIAVEGRMIEPWLGVLAQESREALDGDEPLTLDLAAVTYVGPAAVRLLRELVAAGARLDRVPGLVEQMLEPEP